MDLFELVYEICDSKKSNWVEQAKWSWGRTEKTLPASVNDKVLGPNMAVTADSLPLIPVADQLWNMLVLDGVFNTARTYGDIVRITKWYLC